MRFYTIAAFVLASVVKGEEKDIFGVTYGIHGWKETCGPVPKECEHPRTKWPFNLDQLNKCINKGNPFCNWPMVDFHLEDAVTINIVEPSIDSFVVRVERPLFPGVWRLQGGEIVSESSKTEPKLTAIPGLPGSTIVYKEGKLPDDLSKEDFSKWPKMACSVEKEVIKGVDYHYPFSCAEYTNEVMRNHKEVNFIFLDKQGKPVTWPTLQPRVAKLTFTRTESAPSQIPAIRRDDAKYSLTWSDQCTTPLDKCRTDLKLPAVKICLNEYVLNGSCHVLVHVDIRRSDLSLTPLFINGENKHIPAVYFDAEDILLFNFLPKLPWKEPVASYSFGPYITGPTDIFISTHLGDLSGRLNKKYHTGDRNEPQYFDSGMNISLAGSRYISLDTSPPASLKFDFQASFTFSDINFKALKSMTALESATALEPTNALESATNQVPTPDPALGITTINKEDVQYVISYGKSCIFVPTMCVQTLTHKEAAACLLNMSPSCRMKLKVIVPSASKPVPFKPVKTNIDGKTVDAPVVFFDPEDIFLSSLLSPRQWEKASLEAFSFDLPGVTDLFISHQFGGNPVKGKVLSQVELRENEPFKKSIPIDLTGGQYIFLKHEDHKAGEFSAIFSVSEANFEL